MITSSQFNESAKMLGVEVAAIKAVAEVESGGSGFLSSGEPVILFEPHVFWRQLRAAGINPVQVQSAENADILYPKWGTHPYGKSSEQHARLERAVKINRDAALQSASWGKFQIMGYHFKTCGFDTLQDFINAMYDSEDKHLQAFCHFIKNTGLDAPLRRRDWVSFAKSYNGSGYEKNRYHLKLNTAYLKYRDNKFNLN